MEGGKGQWVGNGQGWNRTAKRERTEGRQMMGGDEDEKEIKMELREVEGIDRNSSNHQNQ